jgi:signal transduction histidine kinase
MDQQLLLWQQALRAGIQASEARARQRSVEMAMGVVRQYDLILGFLERITARLAVYSELYVFFFPVEAPQLLCVYQRVSQPQPVPVEFHFSRTIAREQVKKLFDQLQNERFRRYEHQPLTNHPRLTDPGDSEFRKPILTLLLGALDGYLPRSYPRGATSLVVSCPVPPDIARASGRLRDLSGLLVIFDDRSSFPRDDTITLANSLRKEFDEYFSLVGRYAVRELEFFLSSLMNQDERIQDNQNRALGFIAHLVAHRFRNLREVGEYVASTFSTADSVAQNPSGYQKYMDLMQRQLKRARSLERPLEYIGRPPSLEPILISDLLDVFQSIFDDATNDTYSSVTLEIEDCDEPLLNIYIEAAEKPILDEVFNNHIENMVRAISTPEVAKKVLTLRVTREINYICLHLINYGPPLTPDILEDLQRVVRVRRPTHSGLGMFLSAMIMRHAGGDQVVTSPLPDSSLGVCVSLKFSLSHLKGNR